MKDDIKALLRFKFRSWKLCFVIFFSLFMISFIAGTILYRSSHLEFLTSAFGYLISSFDSGFRTAFSVLLLFLIPFFILFIAGPTVYAPVTAVLTVVTTGLFNGAEASHVMRCGRVVLSLFETIFSSAVSYLLILWATLVTLSALRLFTDEAKGDQKELFTGTMFNTASFRGIFNFKYILTYTGFYAFMSLGALVLTLLRAFTASLF